MKCDGCGTDRFVGPCENCDRLHCDDCALDNNHVKRDQVR